MGEVRVGSFFSLGHSTVTLSEEEEAVKINFPVKSGRLNVSLNAVLPLKSRSE